MPPFLQFVIRRFLVIPVSFVIVTMVLCGAIGFLTPQVCFAIGGFIHPQLPR